MVGLQPLLRFGRNNIFNETKNNLFIYLGIPHNFNFDKRSTKCSYKRWKDKSVDLPVQRITHSRVFLPVARALGIERVMIWIFFEYRQLKTVSKLLKNRKEKKNRPRFLHNNDEFILLFKKKEMTTTGE